MNLQIIRNLLEESQFFENFIDNGIAGMDGN